MSIIKPAKPQADLVSINIFDQINSVCSNFRDQCKKGAKPRLEDFLTNFKLEVQENLFRNLLHIDIEFRRQSGEQPVSADYLERFPQYKRLIREAFFEPTLMSMDVGANKAVTPADGVTASLNQSGSHDSQDLLEKPPAKRLGDYEIVREIGRGGFGVVYEARHLQQENHVALKTLPTGVEGQSSPLNDAERLHKFRREFRSLAEVNHPHLVGMQTLEVDGRQWFFTMDLVDGIDFLDYVRPDDVLNEKRLRSTLPQLASGIMALHGQHIVHRDLKPTNVLVSSDGRVVILDFGLVVEFDRRTDVTMSLQSQHFAGTPRYAAPEQIFGQRTAASDWYALGVMLYEALTGETPYSASAPGKLFLQKQNEDAPRLAGRLGLPNDLAELTDQLLARDPEQRPDALAIAASLSVDLESHSSHDAVEDTLSQSSSTSSASGMILIGRESQLAELEQFRRKLLQEQKPLTVFISGRSGEGKTSLAEKFLAPHRLDTEMLVLSGRCYDRESVPFKAIDCIIDALVAVLRSRKANEVSNLLSDEIPFLAHLFPVLRRVESIAQLPSGRIGDLDSQQIRSRAFAALHDLVYRISQGTPIMMFIDDLQWGDADSADVLSELLMDKKPPVLLFIGSYRSDEADQSPFLGQWHQSIDTEGSAVKGSEVHVGPLSQEQCMEMVVTRIGIDNETIRQKAEELYQSTGGNPYFLDQLIECFDPDTGSFTPAPLNEVIDGRLKKLPTEAAKLLDVIAVSGQALSIGEASEAAGQSKPDVGTITHMRNERLVRLIGSEEQQMVDTYHDKIRETVLDELPEEDRKELHLAIACTIEKQQDISGEQLLQEVEQDESFGPPAGHAVPRVFDLAYHFFEAAHPNAFIYQLLAGEEALNIFASEDAKKYFEKGEPLMPDSVTNKSRYRIWERMGLAYTRLRDADRSIDHYRKAGKVASTELEISRPQFGIARMISYMGDLEEGSAQFDLALNTIGRARPKSDLGKMFKTIFMGLDLVFRSGHRRSKDSKLLATDELEEEIQRRLCSFEWEFDGTRYLHSAIRTAVLGRRSGNVQLSAMGFGLAATVLAECCMTIPAKRCFNRTDFDRNREPIDNADWTVSNRLYRACYLRRIGKPQAAKEEIEKGLQYLERALSEEIEFGFVMYCRMLFVVSNSAEELKWAHELLCLSMKFENRRTIRWGHFCKANALARQGDLQQAVVHVREANCVPEPKLCFSSKSFCLFFEAYVAFQCSDYARARELLDESWTIVRQKKLYHSLGIAVLAGLIQSIVGPDWIKQNIKSDRKLVARYCRQAGFWSRLVRNESANLQRARGRAYLALGRNRKALRCFERAVQLDRQMGNRYPLALSLLDLAAVEEKNRDENRQEAIEILKQTESVIPFAERWLLGDEPETNVVAPADATTPFQMEAGP